MPRPHTLGFTLRPVEQGTGPRWFLLLGGGGPPTATANGHVLLLLPPVHICTSHGPADFH